ncbi:hypothetical protein [Fibrobacter sp. UBA4297]|uniref:hypothetical protein n=1 Tax=Fibrobacter sp. UBA4297 TaxID=1946536 RepID=UPI0025C4B7F6|nr:hypothetical protein [Fibrobacter sp. UBA4297]
MNFIKLFIIAVTASFFQSCFNSDDYIFNESEATDIKIQATLAKSLIETNENVKADTFHINDTIFFLTRINPNKIIKVQDYHWLMDDKYCSSEYNFKKQVSEPGYHKFKFILKDFFGDMHYDSLEIWVADNPVLNDSAFTPANGTQAIDPFEAIYFTWSAKTPGIKLSHHYRFVLSEQSYANEESTFKRIDTILNEPYFVYHHKLNPLKKYNWSVQAFNEYNLVSAQTIKSSFFTKGIPGEGSLQATINIGLAPASPFHLTLQDKDNTQKHFDYNFTLSSLNSSFTLDEIPAGKYQLTILSDYTDFGQLQKDIVIRDGFVTTVNDLKLLDSIPPRITSLTGHDTLDFKDSLRFVIKDGAKSIINSSLNAILDNETVLEKIYQDSILTVILKETDKSWAYRILTISASDGSKNINNKSFYIFPSIIWFKTNNDTTVTSDDTIKLFIRDDNPYGFTADSLKFFNVSTNTPIVAAAASGNKQFSAVISANYFEPEQTIRSTVVYSNGLKQSKNWKLRVEFKATKEEE